MLEGLGGSLEELGGLQSNLDSNLVYLEKLVVFCRLLL